MRNMKSNIFERRSFVREKRSERDVYFTFFSDKGPLLETLDNGKLFLFILRIGGSCVVLIDPVLFWCITILEQESSY